MEMSEYVETLRRDLGAAAAVGGEEIRRAADLLSGALEPSVRLVLLDVLAAAATEVTAALSEAAVEVRLTGREPEIVVTPTPADAPGPAEPPVDDDSETTRITLRLPEALKAAAEQAADRAGQSLNAWLTAAVKRALDSRGSGPLAGHYATRRPGSSLSGWARG